MDWRQFLAADYVIIILGIWLALITFYVIRTLGQYRKAIKILKTQNTNQFLGTRDGDSWQQLKKIEAAQKESIQKYALVRFNPFEDTGGDQSFVVALLDGTNSGLVISSLHSRGGTRVYAKPVVGAKATTHQFSKEEKEVVEKAARHV